MVFYKCNIRNLSKNVSTLRYFFENKKNPWQDLKSISYVDFGERAIHGTAIMIYYQHLSGCLIFKANMRGWYRVNIRQINLYFRTTFFSPVAIISSRNSQNYSYQYYTPLWLQITLNFSHHLLWQICILNVQVHGVIEYVSSLTSSIMINHAFWGKNKLFFLRVRA